MTLTSPTVAVAASYDIVFNGRRRTFGLVRQTETVSSPQTPVIGLTVYSVSEMTINTRLKPLQVGKLQAAAASLIFRLFVVRSVFVRVTPY